MTAVVAEVRGLRRSYGSRDVLAGIDLDVHAGEIVAVIGRSGTGKSTLLRILAGLDASATGQVAVTPRRMMVFQDARLLPWLRVLDNVTLGLGRAARAKGRAALAEVGLEHVEQAWPLTLSGGEAQRVALARALVHEPALLLLDEPFGALDAITRVQMQQLVVRLHDVHRPAVVLVTHDVDEALALADRVLVLAGGALVTEIRPGGELGDDARARTRLLAALDLEPASGDRASRIG